MSNEEVDAGLKIANKIDINLINEWLNYDKETGIITWKKNSGNVKKGSIAGRIKPDGYRVIKFKNKMLLAHRIAYSIVYGDISNKFVDHINGNRDDNRISNLRAVSRYENNRNSKLRKDNKTGIKGVKFVERDDIYVATIRAGGSKLL